MANAQEHARQLAQDVALGAAYENERGPPAVICNVIVGERISESGKDISDPSSFEKGLITPIM